MTCAGSSLSVACIRDVVYFSWTPDCQFVICIPRAIKTYVGDACRFLVALITSNDVRPPTKTNFVISAKRRDRHVTRHATRHLSPARPEVEYRKSVIALESNSIS